MDEELWPVQEQPLALWSPSTGSNNSSSNQAPYSNQPQAGCSTPLASPLQKSFPPYPQLPSHYSSPDHFGQQSPYCSPPSQMPPFQNSTVHSGWPQPPNYPQQFYSHPPSNAPYHHAHPPPQYFPHSEEMLPPPISSSMMMPNGPLNGNSGAIQQQREQRRCMASQQKVQQWQQFGGNGPLLQDSGVHSMSQSTANSVMSSSMSSIHPVSCISAVSSLPDEYPGLQEHPYFQNMPFSIRHATPEKIRKVLPELIPLINDESEDIVFRALTMLDGIARKDRELTMGGRGGAPLADGPLIGEKKVVEELLRTLKNHKKNKKVACYALRTLHFILENEPFGRELFVQTLNAHGTGCLEELVHGIGIQEHSCFKFAFLVLHSLMIDPRIGRKMIAYMCEMRVLTKVLGWLDHKNEKFLNIVTEILHMLISRNSEQMEFFIGLNGHQKLIQILAYSRQERLLFRAVKLLNIVVQMDPGKIIAAGLLEAAQNHLDQGSQRLLRHILDCVRDASHVPSTGHNVRQLLQKLLQLLGTNDLRLKKNCADILANLCANNPQNKEFLVENGAIFGLFQLLRELEALREALGESEQREGIQETTLALLKSLCSGNKQAGMAKRQCLGTEGHKRLLLERMRQQGNLPLLRRTLMLLQQLAQCPPHREEEEHQNLLASLRFALSFPPPFPQLPDAPLMRHNEICSFASQTVLLLHQAMNLLPETGDICQRCLDLLAAMAKDGPLLEEIFVELRARRFRLGEGQSRLMAPQMLLCYYDQLAPNSVALLAELAQILEAAQLLQRDQSTLDCLERWAGSGTPTAQLALRALQLIGGKGQFYAPNYQQQAQLFHPSVASFEGEELAAVLNNSPAQQILMMEFSPATAQQSTAIGNGETREGIEQHSAQTMPNGGEQLATFGPNGGPFEFPGPPDQFPAFPSGHEFGGTDFGPFVSALCPENPPNCHSNTQNRME